LPLSVRPTTYPILSETAMTAPQAPLKHVTIASALLAACAGALAQPALMPPSGASGGNTYVGIGVGRSSFETSCGNIPGLSWSRSATSWTVTAGDMITRYWGAQLSYIDLGRADRAGGSVAARGINASLVGRWPVADSLSLTGRIGSTYGITH